jgi:hypothetical protein
VDPHPADGLLLELPDHRGGYVELAGLALADEAAERHHPLLLIGVQVVGGPVAELGEPALDILDEVLLHGVPASVRPRPRELVALGAHPFDVIGQGSEELVDVPFAVGPQRVPDHPRPAFHLLFLLAFVGLAIGAGDGLLGSLDDP